MNRRSFAKSIGGVAALAAAANSGAQTAARKTQIYRIDTYYLRQGSQGTRLNDFLSSQAKLLSANSKVLGIFSSMIGGQLPATLVLAGFSGVEEMQAADERVRHSADYQAALEKLEAAAEAPYDRMERVLLQATGFSPEIAPPAEKPKKPRVFELRVYHSPTERQLRLLHDRFSGPEIALFHRSGIFPVLYADTIAGPNMPNLTYLTPFAGLAEREAAWDKFGADPDWLKAREESIAKGGQIVAQSTITLIRPAAFSPMQ